MKPAVEIKGLSKSYEISHEQKASYKSLRDEVATLFTKPLKLITGKSKEVETFWALKDVDININPGEVVGIIGRNGSGKSTLLKILSRITEPSRGQAVLRGRVASLLEVGTGFHPELTGRENIFFNGSILGMTKKEIVSKFDEIVDFAEIEKFLDTPVKFYSSGMYVRLAFAIAAHLEPDILIVDEVLAVGDAGFQKKSLGKMKSVAGEGRTVLFVSHNIETVKQLCNKAILLENGKVKASGDVWSVANEYSGNHADRKPVLEFKTPKSSPAHFKRISLNNAAGKPTNTIVAGENWSLDLSYRVKEQLRNVVVAVEIQNDANETIYMTTDHDSAQEVKDKLPGTYKSTLLIDELQLGPGDYIFQITIQAPGTMLYDMVDNLSLTVEPDPDDIRGRFFGGKYYGYIGNKAKWSSTASKK